MEKKKKKKTPNPDLYELGSDIGPEERDQSREDAGKGKEAALGCSASVMMVLTHVGLLGCGVSFGLWAKLATRHSSKFACGC